MRSPDSDETGEVSGGGDSLAEGFGTFLDGDDDISFGDGATRGASDTSALEGLAGTDGTSDAPDEASSGEAPSGDAFPDDDTGDGPGFDEAITGLFDVGAEHEPVDARDTDDGAAAHDDDHHHAHHDDGAFDLF